MGRGAFRDKKIEIKNGALQCKEHGSLSAVTKIEKNGKTYLWYRCLVCRIGVGYDLNPRTNQTYLVEGMGKPCEIEENDDVKEERKLIEKDPMINTIVKAFEKSDVPVMIVGSYALKLNGYSIKPNDVDLVVRKDDLEKAKEIIRTINEDINNMDVEVYAGEVKKLVITPKDYVKMVLKEHIFDDEMIQKIARHALDDERILSLFQDTEIIFLLESYLKEIKNMVNQE